MNIYEIAVGLQHSTLTNGTAGFIYIYIPDDIFRNICANQNRVHFVIFAKLFVQVCGSSGTNRLVYETKSMYALSIDIEYNKG